MLKVQNIEFRDPRLYNRGKGEAASREWPMIESAVTDLPEPDSPTTQSVSPGLMSKLMPSSTVRGCGCLVVRIVSSLILRIGEVKASCPGAGPGHRA